jgi:hypothetical protein
VEDFRDKGEETIVQGRRSRFYVKRRKETMRMVVSKHVYLEPIE